MATATPEPDQPFASDYPECTAALLYRGTERLLIDGIRGKLFALPDSTRVFPGHGPATSIGAERAGNPYCGD